MKIAGVGARSAEDSRAFQLPSGGGFHAAGPRSLGKDRLGLSTEGLGILFLYLTPGHLKRFL